MGQENQPLVKEPYLHDGLLDLRGLRVNGVHGLDDGQLDARHLHLFLQVVQEFRAAAPVRVQDTAAALLGLDAHDGPEKPYMVLPRFGNDTARLHSIILLTENVH